MVIMNKFSFKLAIVNSYYVLQFKGAREKFLTYSQFNSSISEDNKYLLYKFSV